MATRELTRAPRILPLYVRTLAPLLPGASRLPWVAGGGGEIPDLQLTLSDVRVDPLRVADYAQVCGFHLRAQLPASYPHILAFPLHLAAITNGRFPFGAVGLVHLANRITQHRPVRRDESLGVRVHATHLQDHPRGRTFALVTEAWIAGKLVWEEQSTMLHRDRRISAPVLHDERPEALPAAPTAEWRLPANSGRRYAAVSGDRNPIHLYQLTAKAFGFPRAIAHGMWTKARCLAALQQQLPDHFTIDVRFRRPILLPAAVAFASAIEGDAIRFSVYDHGTDTRYLDGRVYTAAGPAGGGEGGP